MNVQLELLLHANEREKSFKEGVKAGIPTLLGYLSIGFAAGVVEQTAGLSILEIALLSILLYAGSAQFIFAGMISASHSFIAIIFTIFFVNLRHLLLSAALSPYFRHLTPVNNFLVGILLTDESFGVASGEAEGKSRLSLPWMHGLNVIAYLNWIAANVAGAFLGQWITSPTAYGLDFALTAMFIGLLVLQMASRKKVRKDVLVGGLAVVLVIVLGQLGAGSLAVILAAVLAAAVGGLSERWK
ncbi:AzlC family ABC transporter permease [Paenibacillus cremeus]|uniref:AzlC family ABC transporter permease n=1 Tax=Paenibacillus cremeus TaxID=2163881 RepID=A0A559KFX4_9BACL|nr:AzlC family ABC transporter permease [Paenibacillus cremeus]TVY11019.1 AzlC family ABC transporter permease [Paenibacillus cremeus]